MSKSILLIAIMALAGLTTLYYAEDKTIEAQMTREVNYFDEETTELCENYSVFKLTLDDTLTKLENRDINLTEAMARVYGAAKQHCPIYLERVDITDPAPSHEASVARNLIGHLISLEEVRPELGRRVAELQLEFTHLSNQRERPSVR